MAVSAGFREYVREQIEPIAPLSMRAMFGGVGLYSGGVFFALIDDDTLFFKVDERNRPDFEAAGMQPFRPFKDERASMQYYELPAEVLEDQEALRRWIRGALEAALGKSARRPARGRAGSPKTRSASARPKRRGAGSKKRAKRGAGGPKKGSGSKKRRG